MRGFLPPPPFPLFPPTMFKSLIMMPGAPCDLIQDSLVWYDGGYSDPRAEEGFFFFWAQGGSRALSGEEREHGAVALE